MKSKVKEWARMIILGILIAVSILLCIVCFAFNITWDTLTDKTTETKCACIVEVTESAEN